MRAYEVRPRKDKRGVDLISDALPFGRLWYDGPNAVANALGYAEFFSRSHDAVIRVYAGAGDVIQTHEHKGRFQGAVKFFGSRHVALPAKMNFHDSAFIRRSREKPSGLAPLAALMR